VIARSTLLQSNDAAAGSVIWRRLARAIIASIRWSQNPVKLKLAGTRQVKFVERTELGEG
jgi:hypothetical protein